MFADKQSKLNHNSYGPKGGRKLGGSETRSLRQAASDADLETDDYVDRGIYGIMLRKEKAPPAKIERKRGP